MKNLSKIKRSVDTDKTNFTPISNMVIQNTNISFEARGLLVYILSLPKDWSISKEQIMKSNKIGRDKFRRMWKELESSGYIESKRLKSPDGTFYWNYQVCDKKLSIGGLSTDGSSTDGKSIYGSSTDGSSTDGKPTDIKKIQEQKIQEQKKHIKKTEEQKIQKQKRSGSERRILDKEFDNLLSDDFNIRIKTYRNLINDYGDIEKCYDILNLDNSARYNWNRNIVNQLKNIS